MSPKKTSKKDDNSEVQAKGFTAEEKAAMKARAQELKKEARRTSKAKKAREEGERDVLAAIAEMSEPDKSMASRVHALVKDSAPELVPRTWYGMPAYAKDGKVVCHFQSAAKFKTRYSTFGFSDKANMDDGAMWPVAYAVMELTAEVEERIAELVRQAVE